MPMLTTYDEWKATEPEDEPERACDECGYLECRCGEPPDSDDR